MKTATQRLAEKYLTAAGYGIAPYVHAQLDPHGLILWTSFASFGRAHHITGHIHQWDKSLYNIGVKAKEVLSVHGILARLDPDVHFEPDKRQPREMQAYIRLFPESGLWEREVQQEIQDVILSERVVSKMERMY